MTPIVFASRSPEHPPRFSQAGVRNFDASTADSVPCTKTDETCRGRHRARSVEAMLFLSQSQRAGGGVTVEEQAVIGDHQWRGFGVRDGDDRGDERGGVLLEEGRGEAEDLLARGDV